MLAFLTDAHISPRVAAGLRSRRPDIEIHALHEWRGGALLDAGDSAIMAAAAKDGLTLVTYDQRTIVPLLVQMAAVGQSHGGVVFIDHVSIAQEDTGAHVRALIDLWDRERDLDWTDAVGYLKRDPSDG